MNLKREGREWAAAKRARGGRDGDGETTEAAGGLFIKKFGDYFYCTEKRDSVLLKRP